MTPPESPGPRQLFTHLMLDDEALGRLLTAHADYGQSVSLTYDQVLHVVAGRVRDSGSVGKEDIGALLFWKRLRAFQ